MTMVIHGESQSLERGIKRKRFPVATSGCCSSNGSDSDSQHSEHPSENIDNSDDDLYSPKSQVTSPSTAPTSRSASQHPSDIRKCFKCNFDGCERSFNRPAKLEQHARSHTNTRPFVCPQPSCEKTFLREHHMKQHITSAHTDIREYTCTWPACGKGFVTATRLRRHVEAHGDREKLKCPVDDCGHTFRKQSTLDLHVAKIHDKIKPFVCAFLDDKGKACMSRFDTAYRLKDHEGRIHRTKRYTCSICSGSSPEDEATVAFSTYMALIDHMKSEHPPTCTECGLRCVTQTTLKSHLEVCHSGLSLGERKKFTCTEPSCEAAFTKKGNLKLHIKTIHAERRFVCDIGAAKLAKGLEAWDGHDACGIALPAKSQMVEHIRTRHLGLSPGPLPRARKSRKAIRVEAVMDDLVGSKDPGARADMICPVDGCTQTFLRQYDIEQHIIATHQVRHQDVRFLPRDSNGLFEKVYLRPSLSDYSIFVTKADLEAEQFFGGFDDQTHMVQDGDQDHFWVGAETFERQGNGAVSWLDEEAEMRRLIDEELVH